MHRVKGITLQRVAALWVIYDEAKSEADSLGMESAVRGVRSVLEAYKETGGPQ